MFEQFPYTNFHDLNMDWIVKICKDFLDQYSHLQETILAGETALQEKAEALEALLQAWYDTHSHDIATQLTTALASLTAETNAKIQAIVDAADAKETEVLASIPDDYTELSKTAALAEYNSNTIKPSTEPLVNLIDEKQLLLATGWAESSGEFFGTAANLATKFGTGTGGFPVNFTFKPNVRYTISAQVKNMGATTSGTGIGYTITYTDDTTDQQRANNSASSYTDLTFTTDAGKTVKTIALGYGSGGTNTWYIKNLRLTEGTINGDYVGYHVTGIDSVSRNMLDIMTGDVNSLVPTDGLNNTLAGVTFRSTDGVNIYITGTANNNRRACVFNGQKASKTSAAAFDKTIDAGMYKVSIESSGYSSELNFVQLTYNTFATPFEAWDGDIITLTQPAMVGFLLSNGTAYSSETIGTTVKVTFTKIENMIGLIRKIDPYYRNTLKESGQANPRGFTHQAFPDIDFWRGKMIISSRVGMQHYTPEDPTEWGGVDIHSLNLDGSLEYIKTFTKDNFTGLEGEVRGGHIFPTKYGLLFVTSTTYYDLQSDPHHDNLLAVLNYDNLSVSNYVVNGISNVTFSGKPILTPDGHIIIPGYRNDNIYLMRSNEVFTGDVSTLTYTKIHINENLNSQLNECSVGYLNGDLLLLARNYNSGDASVLLYCDDPEGTGTWSIVKAYDKTTDSYDTVIHSPQLLPYNSSRYLMFFGANYRSASTRHAVIGIIDMDDNYTMRVFRVDETLNYGGYGNFCRLNTSEFEVAYYKEGTDTSDRDTAIQTAVYYKKVNALSMFPWMAYNG